VLMSGAHASRVGASALARVRSAATFAGEARDFPAAPARAIARAAHLAGMDPKGIDLFEISEAFAVVPIVAMRALGVSADRVNVHGGAISLGHPLGCSGARLLVTLLGAMKRRGARTGCVALCLGGGEAVAMIVER
jgi:acetyl-CoA C-acetyltransferase